VARAKARAGRADVPERDAWLMLDRIYVRGFSVHEVRVPKGLSGRSVPTTCR